MVGATHSTLKALSAMNQHKLLHERPWEPKQLSNFIKLKAYDKYCILYLYEYDLSHPPSPFLHLSQGPHIDPQMHGAIMQALCPPKWLTKQEIALMMAPRGM